MPTSRTPGSAQLEATLDPATSVNARTTVRSNGVMFPQIFGKYVLEREIASGGMAHVYLATLRGAGGFEKRLVVKQIRPELALEQSFIRRFVAEAKTTVGLSHSNIVPVFELGVEQGTYYIAMEFCEGASLAELLQAGPLSPEQGAYVGVEICRALDYAHRKAGVIHGDVTPRNVMVDSEGMVRLIDFGIASSSAPNGCGDGLRLGSPGHAAPEQLAGQILTPAADVFAVGALLVEVWSGTPPFRRETAAESQRALRVPPPDVREVDPRLAALSDVLRSSLALEASGRPQSAEQLSRPLREFLRPTDLGDTARQLGRRVAESRCGHRIQRDGGLGTQDRPSRPPSACGATQTFAVSEQALDWTAKIDTAHPPAGSSQPKPAAGHVGTARLVSWGVALMALGALVGGSSFSMTLPARDSVAEAPRRPSDEAPRELTEQSPGQTFARGEAPTVSERVPSAPSAPTLSGRTRGVSAPDGRPPPEAAGERPKPSRPVESPRARGASVSLTAEPKARVLMDGQYVGHTPVSELAVRPGRHRLRFESEVLGEALRAEVDLESGSQSLLHADFTSALPQVYVR